jgi:hypothetical protein
MGQETSLRLSGEFPGDLEVDLRRGNVQQGHPNAADRYLGSSEAGGKRHRPGTCHRTCQTVSEDRRNFACRDRGPIACAIDDSEVRTNRWGIPAGRCCWIDHGHKRILTFGGSRIVGGLERSLSDRKVSRPGGSRDINIASTVQRQCVGNITKRLAGGCYKPRSS